MRLPNGPAKHASASATLTPPRLTHAHTASPQQSRFFPSAIYGGSPPPEELDHPVYSSSAKRPRVSLPTPKPQVRLPSASPAMHNIELHAPDQGAMPQRSPSFRAGAQPLVQSSDWQARFNGLFGRVHTTTATPPSPPGTPPKELTPSLAVVSLSRTDLFDLPEAIAATVSLPLLLVPQVEEDSATKPMVDDIFDGELSFGSTPKVSIPRSTTYPQSFNGSRNLLKLRFNPKYDRPIFPQSKLSLIHI